MKIARSKTMWFAALLAAFGALEAGFPYLEKLIEPKYYGVSLVVIGIIVAVLRVYTTVPLRDK